MKRVITFATSIVASLLALTLVSSCNNDSPAEITSKNSHEFYSVYSSKVSNSLSILMSRLGFPITRGDVETITEEQAVYLLNLATDEKAYEQYQDSIEAEYGTPFWNNCYNYETLSAAFSQAQLDSFKTFLTSYYNAKTGNGDSSGLKIASLSEKEQRLYNLGMVYVDRIVLPLVNAAKVKQNSGSNCELTLIEDIFSKTVDNVELHLVFDDNNSPNISVYCSHRDVVAVLNAIMDYHKCIGTSNISF